jgi:hypothetical protein
VPDENPVQGTVSRGRGPVTDWVDLLFDFERVYHRKPTSWKDFTYGSTRIPRFHARAQLAAASAARIGGAPDGDAVDEWHDLQSRAAGWG